MDDRLLRGQIFEVDYPFHRKLGSFIDYDSGLGYEAKTWIPGCDYVQWGPEGQTDAVYDGIGKMVLTVVDTFKPGHYPLRVFYTRKWVAPDGKEFGKRGLRICVSSKFKRLAKGYMKHDNWFEMHKREIAA